MSCCSWPAWTFWIACLKVGLGSMLRSRSAVWGVGPAGSHAIPQASVAFEGLAAAVETLGRSLLARVGKQAEGTLLHAVRAKVQEYSAPYDDYVDLVDLCDGLQRVLGNAAVTKACAAVKQAVAKMVLASAAKGSGVARSHGISIYFPKHKVCALYAKLDFAKKNAWAKFIAAYTIRVAKKGWG